MRRINKTGERPRGAPGLAAGAGGRLILFIALPLLLAPIPASASFLSGEALDTAANVLSWVVLVLVPIVGIAIFWMVHVLPEKIAHKNHHPQRKAIQTLCLLSLVFGGLLWPIAWLWAYTRPIGYKMAYGTEKHEDYFREIQERLHAGELTDAEVRTLQMELEAMHARGALPGELHGLREAATARAANPPRAEGATGAGRV
jgi:CBS domain containing-hemolysin-like protein